MKNLLHTFLAVGKWIIVVAVTIEIMSFLMVTLSNFFLYGELGEGSCGVRYDPYTLFLTRAPAHQS